jgi:hypothetical protein
MPTKEDAGTGRCFGAAPQEEWSLGEKRREKSQCGDMIVQHEIE